MDRKKVLVAGWFSFREMGATAGDLMARDVALDWLEEAGRRYDVAVAPPFRGGIDWRSADPHAYSEVVFVCGPFGNGSPIPEFLKRFGTRKLVGLNLSMLEPLDSWNPFDLLLERDSSAASRPDISFLSSRSLVPVVGRILVGPQEEYGTRDMHDQASGAIDRLISSGEMAVMDIDTRLDLPGQTQLRSPAEVESLIARMDLVITTRLHGLALALKNSLPALAIDPIRGGAKLSRQAQTVGWPVIFTAGQVTDSDLREAFDYCVSEDARAKARECRARAMEKVRQVRARFIDALADQRPG